MEPTQATIAEAVALLRRGGLVAFPTETVYGLGADAMNPDAVRRVFNAKGRPSDNPLIVHVADAARAKLVTSTWSGVADGFAGRFWPGPLTLVLPRAGQIPPEVTAGGETVAVRVPDHPIALALLEAFDGPLVAPSANPSGYVSPTRAEHVREHFDERDVFVLDGGPCRAGIESTVVDVTVDPPVILRQGVITAEDLGVRAVPDRPRSDADIPRSPGTAHPHYQPRARVVLVETLAEIDGFLGEPAVVLSPPGVPVTLDPPHHAVPMPEDARGYAAELYAALREADSLGPALIVVAGVPMDGGVWAAIRDRVERAAAR